jgi:hypothetical protein
LDKDKTACGGGSVFQLMYTEKLFLWISIAKWFCNFKISTFLSRKENPFNFLIFFNKIHKWDPISLLLFLVMFARSAEKLDICSFL